MTGRQRPLDDEGVSSVIGAVLVVGLLVVTLIKVQVDYVPTWDARREAAMMTQLQGQFAQIQSDLARHAGNRSTAAITDPVTLTSGASFSVFQSSSAPGTLRFTPAAPGTGLTLSSTQLTIETTGGTDLFGLSETWNSVGAGGNTVTNVTRIDHLRMRIIDPANNQGQLTLTLTDVNGNCAGVLTLVDTVQGGSDNNVESSVFAARSPPGPTCASTALSIEDWNEKKQLSPPYFYWDAFDANSQFPAVIAAAHYPLTVAFTRVTLQGDWTMAYDVVTPGGGGHVGGSGQVVPNYSSVALGGRLSASKSNLRYPSQTYTIEYGAVVLDQPEGSVFAVPPLLSVSSTPTGTLVTATVISLTGSQAVLSGLDQASVALASTDPGLDMQAFGPQITFSLLTTHPTLWGTFWDTTLKAAGLSSASGQYTVATTANSATLTVWGPVTPPGDTTNDVFLTYGQADVSIQLGGR